MSKDVSDAVKGLDRKAAALKIQSSITDLPPIDQKEAHKLPPIKKAKKLIEIPMPLPDQLIEGVLHKGSTMIYGGGAKTNKTFALMDMGISVATGRDWWNLKTAKGKVLYLDFELPEVFFANRLNKIADEKKVSVEELADLDVWNLRGHATDMSELTEEILERIKETKYSLIIVDPIYKVLGERDENSAGDINSLLNEFEKIAVASGASVVAGHHFSKGSQAGKEAMDRVSGSGVFARSPDAMVTITKHEEKDAYTVEATLRHLKSLDPFCVEWKYPLMVRNSNLDPQKLKKPGAAQRRFTDKQVFDLLNDGPLTTGEWKAKAKKELGMSDRAFADYKAGLVNAKMVHQPQGKNGSWHQGAPLVQQAQTPTAQPPKK